MTLAKQNMEILFFKKKQLHLNAAEICFDFSNHFLFVKHPTKMCKILNHRGKGLFLLIPPLAVVLKVFVVSAFLKFFADLQHQSIRRFEKLIFNRLNWTTRTNIYLLNINKRNTVTGCETTILNKIFGTI